MNYESDIDFQCRIAYIHSGLYKKEFWWENSSINSKKKNIYYIFSILWDNQFHKVIPFKDDKIILEYFLNKYEVEDELMSYLHIRKINPNKKIDYKCLIEKIKNVKDIDENYIKYTIGYYWFMADRWYDAPFKNSKL